MSDSGEVLGGLFSIGVLYLVFAALAQVWGRGFGPSVMFAVAGVGCLVACALLWVIECLSNIDLK